MPDDDLLAAEWLLPGPQRDGAQVVHALHTLALQANAMGLLPPWPV